MARAARPPCRCCGRRVAKRPRAGKLRYPHKCPHGNWCPGGNPLQGAHANGPIWGTCCYRAAQQED